MIKLLRRMALLSVMAGSFVCGAQASSPIELKVRFDHDGVPVPHWTLTFFADGTGRYEGSPAAAEPDTRQFMLRPQTWQRMRSLMVAWHGAVPCETKNKNLARVGQKTVDYIPAGEAAAHCSFNYTDSKPLLEAASMWNSLAYTLDEGRKIVQLHRHDRLGLDKELQQLEHALQEGFAMEPHVIEPELTALVQDELLMDRVRARAMRILSSEK